MLLEEGLWTDAYYLAGYAVEFALKAVVARQFPGDCLPDKAMVQRAYTHDLEALLKLARLDPKLQSAGIADRLLQANWSTVSQWSEASRYEMVEPALAASLVSAVGDADHGVLAWLLTHS